jgi:hypothetical protein
MAFRKERLRVRIEGEGFGWSLVPKLSIGFRGLACMESNSNESELRWEFLNRERPLNRAGGSGRARVFVETSASWLYEGQYRVGKVGNRPLPLRDLQGWGAALVARTESGTEVEMATAVEDRGAGIFTPPLFGNRSAPVFRWRAPVIPGREHRILIWSDILQDPRCVAGEQIVSQRDGLLWTFPGSDSVAALAVANQGARNGSFWSIDGIIPGLRRSPSKKLFALLRWLHVPVLNRDFVASMQQAVLRAPVDFVTGWLVDASLPYGLVHRPCELGLDVVIRALLWNHAEKNETTMDRIALAFQHPSTNGSRRSDLELFRDGLVSLGQVCPSLAYSHAARKLRGDKYRRCVRNVAASMLRLADSVDEEHMRIQLAAARRESAELIGLSPTNLEAGEAAFAAHLDNPAASYSQFEPALRRLGETSRGPQFLTAALLLRLAEQSRF